jgi:putative ABC transport system permease protein
MKNYHLDNLQKALSTSVNLGKYRYTIVGIYGPVNKHQLGGHLRKGIIVSLKSMQKYGTGFDPEPGYLQVYVTDPKQVKAISKLVAIKLRERHRGVEDFEFQTADWLDKVIEMLSNVSLLMTIISGVSLIIGGLSIMNVMLSSVSERIREIGIRKALGADNLQIFVQFITETTTLSLTGGCFGFLVGLTPLLFKEAILRSTQGSIEPTILPIHILFTFMLITLLGIIFGLYPAIKASRMNPVEALRYE